MQKIKYSEGKGAQPQTEMWYVALVSETGRALSPWSPAAGTEDQDTLWEALESSTVHPL